MSDKAAINFMRDHWPALAAIAGALIGWGTMSTQLSTIAKNQDRFEAKLDAVTDGVATARANNLSTEITIADLRTRLHALEARR